MSPPLLPPFPYLLTFFPFYATLYFIPKENTTRYPSIADLRLTDQAQ